MNESLVHQVIEAHGGMNRWNQVETLKLHLRIGGNLLASKFLSPRKRPLLAEIATGRIHARLSPFPRAGFSGIFDAQGVRIETGDGLIVKEREVALSADGKVRRRWIWDELDLLYFLGYALWNYSLTPFYFQWPGVECAEGDVWKEKDGACWRTLLVSYPEAFPTHSRRQTFYFDQQGLLRRLDYTAQVFGEWTHGAHYCFDHRSFDGLVFPTHRVVFPRLASGHPFRWLRAMEGWIDDVEAIPKQVAKS